MGRNRHAANVLENTYEMRQFHAVEPLRALSCPEVPEHTTCENNFSVERRFGGENGDLSERNRHAANLLENTYEMRQFHAVEPLRALSCPEVLGHTTCENNFSVERRFGGENVRK